MKRFINKPKNAHKAFSRFAFKINPLNLTGAYMRGGIRLS